MARPARSVDDGHRLVLGRRGLLGRRFHRRFGRMRDRGSLLIGNGRLAQRNVGNRLAAKWIVVEQSDADEGDQEQPEQHGERLHRRKRQPEPALLTPRLLTERRAQFISRLCHGPPRISRATIARGGRFQRGGWPRQELDMAREGPESRKRKRAARGPPFWEKPVGDQFAALLPLLSTAALSLFGGVGMVVAVALMPCRRSPAIFRALSSLASGGT